MPWIAFAYISTMMYLVCTSAAFWFGSLPLLPICLPLLKNPDIRSEVQIALEPNKAMDVSAVRKALEEPSVAAKLPDATVNAVTSSFTAENGLAQLNCNTALQLKQRTFSRAAARNNTVTRGAGNVGVAWQTSAGTTAIKSSRSGTWRKSARPI